jgi:hypothetical protein
MATNILDLMRSLTAGLLPAASKGADARSQRLSRPPPAPLPHIDFFRAGSPEARPTLFTAPSRPPPAPPGSLKVAATSDTGQPQLLQAQSSQAATAGAGSLLSGASTAGSNYQAQAGVAEAKRWLGDLPSLR